MTEQLDLDVIEQRANDATPGPWERWHDPVALVDRFVAGFPINTIQDSVGQFSAADAEFIAHARTDVPALVAEIRRLRAELAEAQFIERVMTHGLDGIGGKP